MFSRALLALRILMSSLFLWAFVDKFFGFGFATPSAAAWIRGGSPTRGFLLNATHGPFAALFQSLADSAIVEWLFMLGLLCLGLGLLFGKFMRAVTVCGSLFMLLIWLSALPPKNNPIIDEHIIYIAVFVVLYFGAEKIRSQISFKSSVV